MTPGVRVAGVFPEGSHPPIVYPVALVAAAQGPERESALRFVRWLQGDKAAAVFRRYGFTVLAGKP